MCVYNHIFTTSQPKTSASGTEQTVRSLWKQPHDGQTPPLLISPQQPDQTATWQLRLQVIYRASTGVVHETAAARSDPVA